MTTDTTTIHIIRHPWLPEIRFNRLHLGIGLLLVAVVLSALGVIMVKNVERQLFAELSQSRVAYGQLEVARGQLLLEESVWAAPERVQSLAKQKGLIFPTDGQVIVVNP